MGHSDQCSLEDVRNRISLPLSHRDPDHSHMMTHKALTSMHWSGRYSVVVTVTQQSKKYVKGVRLFAVNHL